MNLRDHTVTAGPDRLVLRALLGRLVPPEQVSPAPLVQVGRLDLRELALPEQPDRVGLPGRQAQAAQLERQVLVSQVQRVPAGRPVHLGLPDRKVRPARLARRGLLGLLARLVLQVQGLLEPLVHQGRLVHLDRVVPKVLLEQARIWTMSSCSFRVCMETILVCSMTTSTGMSDYEQVPRSQVTTSSLPKVGARMRLTWRCGHEPL